MPASYETHRAQLKAILSAWGMPEDNAEATADILSWADLHGVDSHGMSMIPGYDRLRRSGRANMEARAAHHKGDPGLRAGRRRRRARPRAGEFSRCRWRSTRRKQTGMAIAAVRNSAHFGATGYYTLMAAEGRADRHGLHQRLLDPGRADLRQGSQARHRPMVVRRAERRRAAVPARHGDDDRRRRAHPQQGQ